MILFRKIKITFLLFFLFTILVNAQSRTIKGIVKDETGEFLLGVSIQIKGTEIGTVTGLDGDFSLKVDDPNHKVLTASYLGYISQDVDVSNRDTVTIILKEDNVLLDEVVTVGYSVARKQNLTGSISKVSSSTTKDGKEKASGTWKRSGMKDNSIRLEVGDKDFIPLEAAQMSVQIDGFRVRVLLDCFFYNDKGAGLEGTFKLKLPNEAIPYYLAFGTTKYLDKNNDDLEQVKNIPFEKHTFNNFNMTYQNVINRDSDYWKNVKEAKIVSKQKAAKAYEQIVGQRADPALMEWAGADMFSCKVFPLENNTLHRVVIGYDLNMVEALDLREYIMAYPEVKKELKVDIIAHSTDVLPITMTPEIPIVEKSDNRIYYSYSNPKDKELTIRYHSVEPVMLVQDEVREKIKPEEIDIPYFALNYKVNLPEIVQDNLPQDAIFVLDASISSNPDKFNVWLKLMEEVLMQNRDVIKQFAALSFSIDEKWYARFYRKNNVYNIEEFLKYANTLALEGATDLNLALKEASNPSWMKEGENKPKHIFLMSDGDCNWGETNMHKMVSTLFPGDRIHTYKTGLSGTNVGVLNYLSQQTNGYSLTVTGEEEAELTAKAFRYKPWNIEEIKIDGVTDFLISGSPTQLYNGQKLIFTGREVPDVDNSKLTISLSNGSEKTTLVCTSNQRIESSLVSRIYGQVASSYLENLGFMAEDATVNYSTYYKVPGAYTSLLMLESDWDYQRFGIDDNDASDYVEDHLVTDLVKDYEKASPITTANNPKADFVAWIKTLDEGSLDLYVSGEFNEYMQSIPEDSFRVPFVKRKFDVLTQDKQTDNELELLSDEDIRYDRLYSVASKRASYYGKPSGLRLLSSVIERNPSDIQTIYDVAKNAQEWKMPEYTYYMMKRLIGWRQEEGLAYLTAAKALEELGDCIDLALLYYYISLTASWDSDYGNIRDVAAININRYIRKLKSDTNINLSDRRLAFINYLEREANRTLESNKFNNSEEADILIIVSWNLPDTDIDLHVLDPNGEDCYYANRNTKIGGMLSQDVTGGYGPEMYLLRNAVAGDYKVKLHYYSSNERQTSSKPKCYIDIYRNWGRKDEKLVRKTIQLSRFNRYYQTQEEEDKDKIVLEFQIKESDLKK